MSEFTDLERTVFDAIWGDRPDVAEQLRNFLSDARLSERDNTGHGFYTSFDVVKACHLSIGLSASWTAQMERFRWAMKPSLWGSFFGLKGAILTASRAFNTARQQVRTST